MRKTTTIDLSETDHQALDAIVTDRNSPQKHVWRAQIVLLTAEGCGTMELTRRSGTSKTSVWRWQERFLAEGVPGLLRDKTRPSRIPPLGTEVAARVVAATQTAPGGETTHWTSAAMAEHIGISVSSVQRIWRKHGLQPHKVRQFKLSKDPRFAAKRLDIVGL
jgi:transposase